MFIRKNSTREPGSQEFLTGSTYNYKKKFSALLVESYIRRGELRRAESVKWCGSMLWFGEDSGRLRRADFCRDRFCPMCVWRRSVKLFGQLSKILDAYDLGDDDHKYLFFTVTVRNIQGADLSAALDELQAGHHRMTCNQAWKKRVLGYTRTVEVTRSNDHFIQSKNGQIVENPWYGTFHPHIHYILAVPKKYATKSDDTYWTVDAWRDVWRKSARLDYDPIVEIHKVRLRKNRHKAISEVAKYTVKDSDYLFSDDPDTTDSVMDVLSSAFFKRRFFGVGGSLGRVARALKLDDLDSKHANLTDCDVRGDVAEMLLCYRWHNGAYGRFEEQDFLSSNL